MAAIEVRQVPRVLVTAGRLLVAHWPMLLTLGLLGAGLREAAVWAAIEVSKLNGTLASVVLLLAPLAYLLPLIAMLHLLRESLPHTAELARRRGPEAVTEQRERRLIDVAVSVLVPFLAIYVSYGLFEDDRDTFTNQTTLEVYFKSLGDAYSGKGSVHQAEHEYLSRLGYHSLVTMLGIVAVAWVVRWALGRFERKTRFAALAIVGVLVENYWTSMIGRQTTHARERTENWVQSRRAAHFVSTRYDDVVTSLGPLAHPVRSATDWLFGLVGSLDAVVIVPMAWLTVGAVVLGHKLGEEKAEEPATEKPKPHPAVGWIREVGADVRERWSAFWHGLKLLASAGLAPMLLFGLAFLVAIRIPALVSTAVRWVVGPVASGTFHAFAPIESSLGLALSMVIVAPLLAAAIDWLLEPKLAALSEPSASPA